MGYVVAGYTVVLGILFVYALTLVGRRRRLTRAAMRLESRPTDGLDAARTGGRADDR